VQNNAWVEEEMLLVIFAPYHTTGEGVLELTYSYGALFILHVLMPLHYSAQIATVIYCDAPPAEVSVCIENDIRGSCEDC
jgi:hypothetical protein